MINTSVCAGNKGWSGAVVEPPAFRFSGASAAPLYVAGRGHIGHLAGKPWLVAAFPIARLRYTRAAKRWSLYWRDRNPRFHRYDQLPPSPRVDELLQEADRDPIFWG
jgi:hypothetical protein